MKSILAALLLISCLTGCSEKLPESGPAPQKTVKQTPAPQPAVPQKPPKAEWVDELTGEVLFNQHDIARFDWDRQVFELKPTAAMNFMAWVSANVGQIRGYLVRDSEGIIYKGQLYSSFSSLGCSGPAICIDSIPLSGRYPPPFYKIGGGWPEILSERLSNSLKEMNLVKEIPEPGKVKKLGMVSTGWVPVRNNAGEYIFQVRATIFADTLRIGETARAHFFFAVDREYKLQDRKFTACATITSGNKSFSGHTSLRAVTPNELSGRRVYVCRFRVTELAGEEEETQIQPGPAQISFTIVVIDRKGEVEATCDTKPRDIKILPEDKKPPVK